MPRTPEDYVQLKLELTECSVNVAVDFLLFLACVCASNRFANEFCIVSSLLAALTVASIEPSAFLP